MKKGYIYSVRIQSNLYEYKVRTPNLDLFLTVELLSHYRSRDIYLKASC